MRHSMSGPWAVQGPVDTDTQDAYAWDMINATDRIYLGATYRNAAGTAVRVCGVSQYATGVHVAYSRITGPGQDRILCSHVDVFRARFAAIGATCGHCGSMAPIGQSCGCFHNGGQ